MLILERKLDEIIEVNGGLANAENGGFDIQIVAVQGNRVVKLGFNAPRNITFLRREVADKVRAAEPRKETDHDTNSGH